MQAVQALTPVFVGLGYVFGFVGKVGATVVHGLTMLFDVFASLVLRFFGLFSDTARQWADEWEAAAKGNADSIEKIWTAVEDGKPALEETNTAAQKLQQTLSYNYWKDFVSGAKQAANTVVDVFKKLLDHQKQVTDRIADYQKQIRQFGMTAREKQIDDLGATNGISYTDTQKQQLLAYDAQLTALEEQKKQQEELRKLEEDRVKEVQRLEEQKANRLKQLLEDAKTDEEKMAERWQEIADLAFTNPDAYTKLSAKYFRDLDEMNNKKKKDNGITWESYTAGNAMFRGSQEANDAILRGLNGPKPNGPEDEIAKNTDTTAEECKKQTAELKTLNNRLKVKVVK